MLGQHDPLSLAKPVLVAIPVYLYVRTWTNLSGNGNSIKFWDDVWIPTLGLLRDWVTQQQHTISIIGFQDSIQDNGLWDVSELNDFFPISVVPHLLGVHPPSPHAGPHTDVSMAYHARAGHDELRKTAAQSHDAPCADFMRKLFTMSCATVRILSLHRQV
ncbi:hypothetical protein V6N11_078062 [Hibiscus sabdariffa]|uniref:Uncharacterized protein n=1 Tax=Hibiscus sabdariffa TaxID=183260 RepID=A0ABR2TEW1_9ROSI